MKKYYLFVGNDKEKMEIFLSENIDSAYSKALSFYNFTDIVVLSKRDLSIFFNASIDNKPYRCSVSDESIIDTDELYDY